MCKEGSTLRLISGEDFTEYKWVALSNTTLGVLMASLDGNILLIALPTIAKDLPGTSLIDLLWILLGYQLVTASVLVNFGRLADMFGRVRLYNFGFAVFTAGSALCGLSQTSDQLIAFRMVQAIGAAFLFSNSAAIITDAFPRDERGRALGTNQVAIVVGSVMGLMLGGFLTATAGWRSIFWVNVPIGVFATAWSHYRLRELGLIKKGQRLDIPGNVTFAGGLTCVLLAITLYAVSSFTIQEFYLLSAVGVSLLAAFAFIEGRVQEPMLDFSLFRNRMFSAGNVAIFLNALARGAVSLVLVFYLQGPTMGLDPLAAGIFLIPISASLALFGPISGWLSDSHGARVLSTMGLLISSAGFLLLTSIRNDRHLPAADPPAGLDRERHGDVCLAQPSLHHELSRAGGERNSLGRERDAGECRVDVQPRPCVRDHGGKHADGGPSRDVPRDVRVGQQRMDRRLHNLRPLRVLSVDGIPSRCDDSIANEGEGATIPRPGNTSRLGAFCSRAWRAGRPALS